MRTIDANLFDTILDILSKRQNLSLVLTPQKTLIGIFTLRHIFHKLLDGKT